MFTDYVDCEITIHDRKGDSYPLTFYSKGSGDAEGLLRLPFDDPIYQELAENLKNLQVNEAMLAQLGQVLFGALFQDKIKERYTFSQGTLQAGQGLRLVLNIGADEQEVGALPWEFLYDPDQAGPMALLDMPIVRYLPQPQRMPTLKTDLPLKVLLTGAQTPAPLNAIPAGARDQTPENITRELAEVHAALVGMGDHVRIEAEEHITTSKLQKLLRQGFHIWHFVGHGSVNADGTAGRLQFEDGNGGLKAVSAQELGILLNRSSVRLVMLNSCQSGQLALDPFRSMAPALIRAQIPAVVAMQFSVPQHSARAFAVEFYRALAEGFPIDACVTEGRKAVMNAAGLERADWGIPVVYTRAQDGRLFDLPPLTPGVPKPLQAHETIDNGNRLGIENSLEQSAGQIGRTGDSANERMKDMDILVAYKQLPLTEQRPRLRQFLLAHFDEDEINDLCFDLRINVQDLGAEGRKNKVRALIEYCERHSRIDDLVTASSRLHPDEDWVGLSQQPSPASVSQPVRQTGNTAERQAIQDELDMKTRYLYDLKLKAAMQGINTPPDVNIQIENLEGKRDRHDTIIREGEIDKLKRRLKELGG